MLVLFCIVLFLTLFIISLRLCYWPVPSYVIIDPETANYPFLTTFWALPKLYWHLTQAIALSNSSIPCHSLCLKWSLHLAFNDMGLISSWSSNGNSWLVTPENRRILFIFPQMSLSLVLEFFSISPKYRCWEGGQISQR